MQKRIPWYANGSCPTSRLIVIASGTDEYGYWEHRLPRATLRRWRDLQRRARVRSGGRELAISAGWSTDRPVNIQTILWKKLGIYAATPRTSSHGMVFEGQQTAAIDAGNWAWVYANCGGYAAWQEDVRAAGFTRLPDGYQQEGEYHHIIDWNPWDDEPEFGGAPAATDAKPLEEDDMFSDDDRARAKNIETMLSGLQNAIGDPQHGVAVAAVQASERAGNAENIASEVRNLILDPKVGILQAIGQAKVAVTSEQLEKMLDAVGAAARDGGEDGARKALSDLTFVVTAS